MIIAVKPYLTCFYFTAGFLAISGWPNGSAWANKNPTIQHPVLWVCGPGRERNYLSKSAPRRRGFYPFIGLLLNVAKGVPGVRSRLCLLRKRDTGGGAKSASTSVGRQGSLNYSSRRLRLGVAVPVVYVFMKTKSPRYSLGSGRQLVYGRCS